jgi:hypothetical protein
MLYRAAMEEQRFSHAALKPLDGRPITKHKSFPKRSPGKLRLYRLLGYYSEGGRYATARA